MCHHVCVVACFGWFCFLPSLSVWCAVDLIDGDRRCCVAVGAAADQQHEKTRQQRRRHRKHSNGWIINTAVFIHLCLVSFVLSFLEKSVDTQTPGTSPTVQCTVQQSHSEQRKRQLKTREGGRRQHKQHSEMARRRQHGQEKRHAQAGVRGRRGM